MARGSAVKSPPVGGGGGSLTIGITAEQHVYLNIGRPVPGLTFTPDQAREIGLALIEAAAAARKLVS